MTRARGVVAVFAVSILVGCRDTFPSSTLRIESATSCTACIALTELVRIGDDDGPGIIAGEIASLAATPRNEFVVPHADQLKIYSADGRFLRSVGREGEGPGEFRMASRVVLDDWGDVHVFDPLNSRHTIFSPDFEVLGTNPLRGSLGSVVPVPGEREFVVNMPLFTSDHVGYPLHTVSYDSLRITASFGLRDEAIMDIAALRRLIAVDQRGYVFSMSMLADTIEVWDRAGRRVRTLVPPGPNAPPPPRGVLTLDSPPPPLNAGLHVDGSGYLWVVRWRPRSDWAEQLVTRTRPDGREYLQPAEGNNSMYNTRIDVLDPSRGVLLASAQHDAPIYGFLSDTVAHGIGYSESGAPQIVLWTVNITLSRGEGRR